MTLTSLPRFPLRKFAGALAVLALHLLVVLLFIQATHHQIDAAKPVREILLWLAPAKPEVKLPPARAKSAAKPLNVTPLQRYPDYSNVTLPPLPGHGTALRGLPSLFDCAPGNRGALTPEQIAQCAAPGFGPVHDNAAVDYADHTNRSHSAAFWARGRARKNAPLLLPCMDPNSINPLGTLICLGKAAAAADEKFDLDKQPGYGDKPEELHIPNNGDPPDPSAH
ncbi:MAG TPA: hypothetical protein VIJ85_04845 [Rhizomicrobium sp.]